MVELIKTKVLIIFIKQNNSITPTKKKNEINAVMTCISYNYVQVMSYNNTFFLFAIS